MSEITTEKPDSVQIKQADLDRIRTLAKAATLGPWEQHEHYPHVIVDGVLDPICEVNRSPYAYTDSRTDAAYISAASPDVVLDMVSEIERLRAENKRLLVEAHDLDSSGGEMAKDYRQLEKEADWLAEQLLACTDDNRIDTCRYTECGLCSNIDTVALWREAAHRAVESKPDLFDHLAEHPDTKLAPEG